MDVAGPRGYGFLKDMIHESDNRCGPRGGPQSSVILQVDVVRRQVPDQFGEFPLVGRTDSLYDSGRRRHDGLDVAAGVETELFQRLLVQRVGHGQPECSVGGRQRENGPRTGQSGVYQPQSIGLADQRAFMEGEPELGRLRESRSFGVDVSSANENVAKALLGALLLIWRSAQMPLFEPPSFHQRLAKPKRSCGHGDTLGHPDLPLRGRIGQDGLGDAGETGCRYYVSEKRLFLW